jgi:hypothetical protein
LKELLSPTADISAVAVTGPIPSTLPRHWQIADLAVAIELSDLSVVTRNPCIQFDQFFPQLSHKRANKAVESAVLIVADDPHQSSPQIADVLRDDNAVLPEKTADLIDEPDAIRDQAAANPMNPLHRQLFGGLDRHKTQLGRLTASQMASASFRSFLLDFT